MPLEATMIIVDNSEQSRNGDYLPNRFDAQSDAVSMIFRAKTSANPESSVGLMSMGGAQPDVLTTLTTDFGRIIEGLHRTKIRGESHFATALNVAGLALKHRQNKSQHQRIIVFTCSPISTSKADLDRLAKRLKKTSFCVDVIAFGDLDPDNLQKLESFHANIKAPQDAEHQSHLAVIPPGPNILSDSIVSTPILDQQGGGGGGMGAGSGGGGGGGAMGGGENDFPMGVDPNVDPELALALRMSMEEEERRAQREKDERDSKKELETVPEGEEKGDGSGASKDDAKKDDNMDTS